MFIKNKFYDFEREDKFLFNRIQTEKNWLGQ